MLRSKSSSADEAWSTRAVYLRTPKPVYRSADLGLVTTFAAQKFIRVVATLLADNPKAVAGCLSKPEVLCRLLKYHLPVSADLVKEPRWQFDSLIVRLRNQSLTAKSSETLGIKIHDDIFPLAAHIYNSPDLLAAAASTGHAVRVRQTSIIETRNTGNRLRCIRFVLYDMVEGENLAQVIEAGTYRLQDLRKMLKVAFQAMLSVGIHPLLRDLSDFTLTKSGRPRLVMTDYNALIECTRSGPYSTNGVTAIVSPIIDVLIGQQYRRYSGAVNAAKNATERLGVPSSAHQTPSREYNAGRRNE